MIRHILAGLALLGALAATDASAQAPATVKLCVQNGTTCTPVTTTNPLPITGGGGGGAITANQGTPAAITGGWPVIDGAGTDTTGTLTSGAGTVNASIDGYASIKAQVKGTYAGFTFSTKVSSDGGTTFVPIQCALVDGSQFGTSFTLTANQSVELACGHLSGDDTFQISTAAGPATGTANIDISPSAFPSGDGQTVAAQISQGGNIAVVKPASTAAVATDPALVMQLNPSSPGIIALGQTVKASSVPTTFATDQYVDPCMNPLIAKSSVAINITSATTTQLVAISGSTAIYVCHFNFTISEVITTANTLQFEYGTSTTCVGANKLTGLYGAGGITVSAPVHIQAGYGGTMFTAPASNGLCALTAIGASGSFQGVLTYVQQ